MTMLTQQQTMSGMRRGRVETRLARIGSVTRWLGPTASGGKCLAQPRYADRGHDAPEIIGKHMQAHFRAYGLRVRPRSYAFLTELSEHQSNRGPAQEGQCIPVEAFPVFGQAAAAIEPADGSLDDPALG